MVNTRSSRTSFAPPSNRQKPPSRWDVVWGMYAEADHLLSREQLARLAAHEYSSVDTSWLDELCMKVFWERVVQLYPTWLAPNLITLLGLIVNLVCCLVLCWYCPTAKETAPGWTYFLAAAGVFAYQTLDATDGKQARRIGCASPLGELFDHGCDSVSQVFITLHICYAFKLGDLGVFGVFPVCVLSIAIFYCAHWSTYCTGRLQFARFDVTEAQMIIISLLALTGLIGPELWTIGIGAFQLRILLLFVSFIGLLQQFASYLTVIMNDGCGKNGATVAGTSVIFPIFPLLSVIIPFMMIHSKCTRAIYTDNIAVFVMFLGAVAAKATNRVIVAYMSRSELFIWDWIYVGPLVVILNQYWNLVLPEVPLLYAATAYAYVSLLIYCYNITKQLCDHLGIYCFTVPSQPLKRS